MLLLLIVLIVLQSVVYREYRSEERIQLSHTLILLSQRLRGESTVSHTASFLSENHMIITGAGEYVKLSLLQSQIRVHIQN